MKKETHQSVDEYIALQPASVQPILKKLRHVIQKAAPKADEAISYNMPAYKQDGVLIYFACFKGHYSIFPTSSPIKVFAKQLKRYKTSKGTVQFLYDKPLPVKLITDIVKFKLKENHEKKLTKKMKLKKNYEQPNR